MNKIRTRPMTIRADVAALKSRPHDRPTHEIVEEINSDFKKTSDACVVFHSYYEDVTQDILTRFLVPMAERVDLVFTTPNIMDRRLFENSRTYFPKKMYILKTENRGRDIRPFLLAYRFIAENEYEIACKIHTKKSPHLVDGDFWRTEILNSLLESPKRADEIIRRFLQDEALGLAVPRNSLMDLSVPKLNMGNRFWLDELLTRIGEVGQLGRYEFDFPAGSMFWFRIRSLGKLLDTNFVGLDEFEAESGQLDGALQHAIERMACLLVEKSGFKIETLPFDVDVNAGTKIGRRKKTAGNDKGSGSRYMAKTAIMVAGMHRSGTSAVTRVLSLMGCRLPGTLMKQSSGNNEAGFWESLPIMHLNDDILASAGSSWSDWRAFDPAWYTSPVADEFRERARAVLESEYGDSRLFVLKDPRICRLLPFWIEAAKGFGAEPLVVAPVRNPLDVAASLEVRDRIDPSVGHLVWLRHVLDAESASRDVKRAWLRYEQLLSNPWPLVDRLGDELGVSWPKRTSIDAEFEVDSFLAHELHHHRSEDANLHVNPKVSPWIRSSFQIFDRWAQGRVRKADIAALNRIKSAFDVTAPVFGRIIAVSQKRLTERDERIEEAGRALAERGRRINGLNQAVAERDGRIEEAGRALAERDGRIEEAGRALAERDERIEEAGRALAERGRRINGLNQAVAERDGRIEEASRTLAERDQRIEEAGRALAERDERIEEAGRALAERDERIEEAGRALAERGRRINGLNQAIAERDGRIEEASRALTERDERIEEAGRALVERDERIEEASRALTERDERIGEAGRALAERDERIEEASRALTERDERIEEAGRALAERDERIEEAGRALAEHGRRINGLNQAVAERDERISGLNRALAERDERISGLNRALAERDERIIRLSGDPAERDGGSAGAYDSNDRRIAASLQSPEQQVPYRPAGRVRRGMNGTIRTLYRRAPLPLETKMRIKERLFLYAPVLFRHMLSYRMWENSRPVMNNGASRPRVYLAKEISLSRREGEVSRLESPDRTMCGSSRAITTIPSALTSDIPPLCLLTHVYYPELWAELSGYIGNLPEDAYHLYVNLVDTTFSHDLISRIRDRFPSARIYVSENHGRDIGGHIRLLENVQRDNYRVYGLIHTKMSPQLPTKEAALWRGRLLAALMGTKERAAENIDLMLKDETIGQIAAVDCRHTEIAGNQEDYDLLLDRLDIGASARDVEYVTGTMMFLRADVLWRVFDGVRTLPFEHGDAKSSGFHRDGQWEHAVERIIGSVVRDMNYRFEWR